MSKQQLAQIGLAVGTIASPEFERFAGLASAGLGVLFLKYSRDAERQADDLGLRYMRRVNYDPREMPHVFELLTRVSQAQGGGRVPEWLATHPDPENRRGRIEQEVAALPQSFSGAAVNREEYLRRLDGLVFGNNPREGYFKDSHFFHPELRFRVTFPEGWTTSNGRAAVVAVSPEKDAAVELRSEEHTSELQSQSNLVCRLLLEKKKIIDETLARAGVAKADVQFYAGHQAQCWFPALTQETALLSTCKSLDKYQ